jgi:hypothetical protein
LHNHWSRMSGKRALLMCIAVAGSAAAAYAVALWLRVPPERLSGGAVGIHCLALGIKRYQDEKGQRALSKKLANFRCPFCGYFVDSDARDCAKCRRPIVPRADG